MSSQKTILLIDDNVDIREIISVNLESEGYGVIQANDGAEALNLIDNGTNYYCVICDLQMPHISGIMFLKIIRERGLKTPLIFITGFDNILETEEAFRLGAQAFLSKPFENSELYKLLNGVEAFNTIVNRPETEMELGDYYCKVHIDEFVTGKKIIYPVYLKLSSSKFIKIAHNGEDLDQKKIDNIKKHGVEYFYLENADFNNYIKRNIQIAKNLLLFKGIPDSKKREFFIGITKNLIEYEFNRDMNSETISMALFAIHNTLQLVNAKKDFMVALQSLHDFSPSIVEHSMLVSMIASAIALQSGNFNNKTVTSVALAGLYHDFGLKELPEGLVKKNIKDMNAEELALYKTHPQLSSQVLSSIEDVPEAVPQGVLGHHEHADGSGYPFGIGRMKIHPIGRILCLADQLAEKWNEPENQKASLASMISVLNEKKELYDKDYFNALHALLDSSKPIFKSSV